MCISTSKPANVRIDPLSIRPKPNERYENVTGDDLLEIGDRIITTRYHVRMLEGLGFLTDEQRIDLREWRKTMRLLLLARRKMQRAVQMRLF